MGKFLQVHKIAVLLAASSMLFYISFAYDLERSDFIKLISLYTGLFFFSWKLYQIKKTDFWFLAGLALVFRLLFIGAIPNLSQDFYRFIWDGRMLAAGWNPYLYLPENLIAAGTAPIFQAEELYNGMGQLSASHYTNYPPLNQLIFALAGLFSKSGILGAVMLMRVVIIAADVGTLFLSKKILEDLGLPGSRAFLYILNPFVIIELTGNLHFEGVMVFFLVLSLYLLHKKKWIGSAVMFSLSVLLKLLPLLFLPLLFGYFTKRRDFFKGVEEDPTYKLEKKSGVPKAVNFDFGFWKLSSYYLIVGGLIVLGFLPFLSMELVSNFSASVGLWFQKFEFNASIYYLVRWIGFQVKGYNIIATAGKVLPVIVILVLLSLSFFKKNNSLERLITSMMLGVSIYFFFSTTIHPWYIATPLVLSIFTKYRFTLVWSFAVIFSYYAYSNEQFKENLWLVGLEYLLVFGVFLYEIYKNRTLSAQQPVLKKTA
jgi:alpha-1,6-mannosyltransferase